MINIESLKRNILSLALEGKLTDQLPSDGDSNSLIIESVEEKQKALKLKKAELHKPEEEDKVFSIPESWNWVKLSDISQIESGGTPSRGEKKYWNGTIPWLKIGDLNSKYVTNSSEFITELGLNNSSARVFKKGTILYTIFATIGVVSVLDIDASTNQAIAGLTFFGKIDRDYLYYVLVGLKDVLVGKSHGMTQSNINLTILKNVFIPMPPLEEQKRIVAKLDEIFAELDKIDEKQTKIATIQEKMEAKILKLAIKGKLVEQRPEEGTGEELFKLIQEEKQELIKQGKIKKEKPLPAIDEDEVPFDIPSTWKWVRIGNIFNHSAGKSLNSSDTEGKKYTYITTSNVYWNKFVLDELKSMYYKENELEKCSAKKGDLLVLEGGDIGRAAIWNYDYDMRIQNHIHRLRPLSGLKIEFYYYLFFLYKTQNLIDGRGIGLQGLSANKLKSIIMPLPPLEEQKRIVAKIEELLPLCRGN